MNSFWTRRIIYIVFAIALSIPLVIDWQVPPDVGPEAKSLYEAIERVPADKIVLINLQFEAGTIAENGPQTSAIVSHLMKRGTRFAFIGLDPVGPGLGQELAEPLARRYHRPYGDTWVNLGYNLGTAPILKGLARDLPGTVKKDIHNTPLSNVPAMKGIKSAKDIGLLIDIDPTASYLTWIQYFSGPYRVPFAVAPTSVMISDIYPFMNSGQVVGMLKGIAGAAQYEKLAGAPGDGYKARMPVFMAHVTIILLILVGNMMEIQRRKGAQA
jgi:hypothetical protein